MYLKKVNGKYVIPNYPYREDKYGLQRIYKEMEFIGYDKSGVAIKKPTGFLAFEFFFGRNSRLTIISLDSKEETLQKIDNLLIKAQSPNIALPNRPNMEDWVNSTKIKYVKVRGSKIELKIKI